MQRTKFLQQGGNGLWKSWLCELSVLCCEQIYKGIIQWKIEHNIPAPSVIKKDFPSTNLFLFLLLSESVSFYHA